MFEAECQAIVGFNGIVKILLTIDSKNYSDLPEHVFLNVLRERIDFQQGDIVEIVVRKKIV